MIKKKDIEIKQTTDTGLTLNDDQFRILKNLFDFATNWSSNNYFAVLKGYAGTGKTTLILELEKYLKEIGTSITFSAPTHRALSVIRQWNPEAEVYTLAKLFGLRPDFNIEQGDYSLEDLTFNQQAKPTLYPDTFLVIDESSMIPPALLAFIEKTALKVNAKILFVGDPAQLMPVKQKEISPVFSNYAKTWEMTKVERTGQNPLLKESLRLREGQGFSFESNINNEGEGVTFELRAENIHTIIEREFSKLTTDSLHIRCLAGTKALVDKSNERIRNILGYTGQLVSGEILMGYDNWGLTDWAEGSYMIINSGDYLVESIVPSTKEIEDDIFKGYTTTIVNCKNNTDVKAIFIVDNTEDPAKIQRFTEKIRLLNVKGGTYSKEAKIAYARGNKSESKRLRGLAAEFFGEATELKNRLAFMVDHYNTRGEIFQRKTLGYGYAHSIHKS